MKRNYEQSHREYIQFLVAGVILLGLIVSGCIFLGVLNSSGETGESLRRSIPGHESVKIALIAIALILICVEVSVVIVFIVEFGTRTVVTITRIYDYFPDDKRAKKNKITPY